MAAVGVGVAHLGDHRQFAVVPHLHQGPQGGVQAQALTVGAQVEHLLSLDGDVGAQAVVELVAVGDEGIELVVAAKQVDHHQDFVFGLGGQGGFREQRRGPLAQGQREQGFLDKVASVHIGLEKADLQ